MQRLLVIIFAALLIFPASSAHAGAVYERVIKSGTIRCGYAMWPPMLYNDLKTNVLKGALYELTDALGSKLDLKIEWAEEAGWGNIVEGLATGRYDMICTGLYSNAARSKRIAFSKPYLYSAMYVAVRQDETRITKKVDLNDPKYKIAVLEGEAGANAARKAFPRAQIYAIPQLSEYPQVYEEVRAGKADAILIEMATFIEYNEKNPDQIKVLLEDPVNVFPVTFGLPQEDLAFQIMINAALTELLNDGTVEQLLQKYEKQPGVFLRVSKPYEVSP